MTTPNFGLPALATGQDGAETLLNTGLQQIDALMHLAVESRSTTAEPGSPANGQIWLVPTSATGTDWAGEDGKLAHYYDGWTFTAPVEGVVMWVKDEDASWTYDGTLWLGEELTLLLSVNDADTITSAAVDLGGMDTAIFKLHVPDAYLWMSAHFAAVHDGEGEGGLGDWTLAAKVGAAEAGTAAYALSESAATVQSTEVVHGTPVAVAAGDWNWAVSGPSATGMHVQILLKLRRA